MCCLVTPEQCVCVLQVIHLRVTLQQIRPAYAAKHLCSVTTDIISVERWADARIHLNMARLVTVSRRKLEIMRMH